MLGWASGPSTGTSCRTLRSFVKTHVVYLHNVTHDLYAFPIAPHEKISAVATIRWIDADSQERYMLMPYFAIKFVRDQPLLPARIGKPVFPQDYQHAQDT